jgi:hypothetical protein
MALPAHLARYDQLLDLLAEELVREMEQESQAQMTPETSISGGVDLHQEPQHDLAPAT